MILIIVVDLCPSPDDTLAGTNLFVDDEAPSRARCNPCCTSYFSLCFPLVRVLVVILVPHPVTRINLEPRGEHRILREVVILSAGCVRVFGTADQGLCSLLNKPTRAA